MGWKINKALWCKMRTRLDKSHLLSLLSLKEKHTRKLKRERERERTPNKTITDKEKFALEKVCIPTPPSPPPLPQLTTPPLLLQSVPLAAPNPSSPWELQVSLLHAIYLQFFPLPHSYPACVLAICHSRRDRQTDRWTDRERERESESYPPALIT